MSSTNKESPQISDLQSLDDFLSEINNTVNTLYISKIPDSCKEAPCILGIDEAGRGPVLGPMVYGVAFCPVSEQEILKSLKCADSKTLNEKQRDNIFEEICKVSDKVGFAVEVIAPTYICNSMLSRSKYSLNQVSMDSAIKLAKTAIGKGANISHIFVDTVGKPEKYQAYLKTIFPDINVTVAKKADSLYPIVSAASICAKVTRDHALYTWKFPEGLDISPKQFGSGYPGDPTTKTFLKDHMDPVFGFPQLVRFSWSTAAEVLKNAYHVEWENADDETTPEAAQSTSITSFFKATRKRGKPKEQHEFFTQRCLSRKVEF